MNQNLCNSLGLDQFQPPQYSVVYQPPQETNMEINVETPSSDAIHDFFPDEELRTPSHNRYEDIDTIPKSNQAKIMIYADKPFQNQVADLLPIMKKDIDGTNYLIDSIIDFSPKIDPLLEEFADELTLINPIPSGIVGADFDPEGDISLVEKLLYDNSSHRPPKELNSKIFDAMIESFSSSPIPMKDSDSLMEEIDIFLAADDSIPSGIDSEGYNSKEDNLFIEYEPDPGELIELLWKIFLENLEFICLMFYPPNNPFVRIWTSLFLLISADPIFDPLSSVLETLLPFSSKIKDKVFKPGILVSKEEKSPHLLSHRGFKAFKIIHNFLNESPMMIYGGDMPILDVPYLHFYPPLPNQDYPDYEDSRARGFVQRSLDLHSFACLFWESYILDLIE
ncbi:hypothetical protein Tco_0086586 [Tanacetum coccineum]